MIEFGDFFDGTNKLDELRVLTYLRALEAIGCDAVGVTSSSFAMGLAFLEQCMKDSFVPFVSSNATHTDTGARLGERFVIKETSKHRVGITSIADDRFSRETGVSKGHPHDAGFVSKSSAGSLARVQEKGIKIDEPFKALAENLSLMEKQCDILIVMSSLSQQENERIADRFPRINVIVGNNGKGGEKLAGGTLIVNNRSNKGKLLGRLTLAVSGKNAIAGHTVEWLSIDKKLPDNKEVRKILDGFYDAVAKDEKLWQDVEPKLASFDLEKDQSNQYVGAANCASCHEAVYRDWRKSKHARAYNTLLDRNRHFFPDCVSCHTTGAGLATGFQVGQATGHLEGVQCEICHGPASEHVATDGVFQLRKAVPEELCVKCHDSEVSPNFKDKFEALMRSVNHANSKGLSRTGTGELTRTE
ncbi:MAG: hypothetical protein C4532_00855 [Candidatus Abyssobacteria bacterium SURF_17]|uniref:Cytochrome c-552/4 domain-containing protein n=1 Tax=Candidatus Abyssobacteria bacterium SURF_17 TaxID=2093361 RepID=A0A419F926_9BACT|nr:MAG: hypothetical protein C4532_00855 [Candidatus Abyssubacteria bacterium SURF_17]